MGGGGGGGGGGGREGGDHGSKCLLCTITSYIQRPLVVVDPPNAQLAALIIQ